MVRRSIFDKIFKEMQNIRFRLDDLENNMASWNPKPVEISESKLISLPDHLRRTYMIVASKGECSAIQVSNLSGRSRAIESNYLNQLTRMGWLNKRRVSKTTHFRPISEKMLKKPASAKPKTIDEPDAEAPLDLKKRYKKTL
jgi:predicted transcriptional regulator